MNKCNGDTATMVQSDANLSESGRNRVYLDFYNLREAPFSITPDPEFLFFSNTHKSVINKVLYGIDNRMGFILLIGEVGTGKTTICRSIMDKLDGNAELVYLINPSVSGKELISGILDDLGIPYPPESSKKDLIGHLNHFFLSADYCFSCSNLSVPISLMRLRLPIRSERKIKPNTLEVKLCSFLHSLRFSKSVQSAQLV